MIGSGVPCGTRVMSRTGNIAYRVVREGLRSRLVGKAICWLSVKRAGSTVLMVPGVFSTFRGVKGDGARTVE